MEVIESRIPLANGREIVSQTYSYNGIDYEIAVCIWENGVCIQDICIIRPEEEDKKDVEVLVFGDETMEDYTHRFVIPQVEETE